MLKDQIKEIKEKAILEINSSANYAYSVKNINTEEYSSAKRKLFDSIKKEFYNYLLSNDYNTDLEGYKYLSEDKQNELSEKYIAVITYSNLINLIDDYNHEKGEYFNFFIKTVQYKIITHMNNENFLNKRVGITNVLSERDKRIFSDFSKFKKKIGGRAPTNEDFEEYSQCFNIDKSKIILIWNSVNNANTTSLYAQNNDDEEYCLLDNLSNAHIDIIEPEIDEFIKTLLLLNDIYNNNLGENHKNFLPKMFTNNYIDSSVKIIKEKYNLKSKDETIKQRWSEINLEEKKRVYAVEEYLFMKIEIFDYVIETKKILKNKDFSVYFGLSEAYLSKEYKKLFDIIKEKSYEKEN